MQNHFSFMIMTLRQVFILLRRIFIMLMTSSHTHTLCLPLDLAIKNQQHFARNAFPFLFMFGRCLRCVCVFIHNNKVGPVCFQHIWYIAKITSSSTAKHTQRACLHSSNEKEMISPFLRYLQWLHSLREFITSHKWNWIKKKCQISRTFIIFRFAFHKPFLAMMENGWLQCRRILKGRWIRVSEYIASERFGIHRAAE